MAEVKNDAEKLDRILSHLDSAHEKMDALTKRMDAAEQERTDSAKRLDAACARMDGWDKARKDAAEKEEEEAKKADAARKDADEKEKEEKAKAEAKRDADEKEKAEQEKKDAAARAGAGEGEHIKKLQAQVDSLMRSAPAAVSSEVRQRMVGHQAKAERVAQAFGDSQGAPTFVNGESEQDYRIRLLSKYQKHSKPYKDSDLAKVQDESIFKAIEESIYSDAMAEANHPSQSQPGVLIPQRIKDAADRTITRYVGDPNACWDQFNPPVRHVRRILTNGSARVQ